MASSVCATLSALSQRNGSRSRKVRTHSSVLQDAPRAACVMVYFFCCRREVRADMSSQFRGPTLDGLRREPHHAQSPRELDDTRASVQARNELGIASANQLGLHASTHATQHATHVGPICGCLCCDLARRCSRHGRMFCPKRWIRPNDGGKRFSDVGGFDSTRTGRDGGPASRPPQLNARLVSRQTTRF